MADLYRASESFFTKDAAGVEISVQRGITVVTGDSDIYKRYPQFFEELAADHGPARGYERATAEPEVEKPERRKP